MKHTNHIRIIQRRSRTAILTGLVASILGVLAVPTAAVGAGSKALQMVVYSNTVQGRRLLRGRWQEVLSMASANARGLFEGANNRCVSLTLAGEFASAGSACEQAVDLAFSTREADQQAVFSGRVFVDTQTRKAMALNNRGVLRALEGDHIRAREDFRMAVSFTREVKAARTNLEILGEVGTLAHAR